MLQVAAATDTAMVCNLKHDDSKRTINHAIDALKYSPLPASSAWHYCSHQANPRVTDELPDDVVVHTSSKEAPGIHILSSMLKPI
jgi:hypothetical protein